MQEKSNLRLFLVPRAANLCQVKLGLARRSRQSKVIDSNHPDTSSGCRFGYITIVGVNFRHPPGRSNRDDLPVELEIGLGHSALFRTRPSFFEQNGTLHCRFHIERCDLECRLAYQSVVNLFPCLASPYQLFSQRRRRDDNRCPGFFKREDEIIQFGTPVASDFAVEKVDQNRSIEDSAHGSLCATQST